MTDPRPSEPSPAADAPAPRVGGSPSTRRWMRRTGAALSVAVLLAGCASTASTTDSAAGGGEEAAATADGGTSNATSESALFDPGTVQDIEITFDQADYDAMIETFSSSGDKEWIEADVTIDGQTITQAGMRLKGNSSLMSLRGGGSGRGGGVAGTASADDPSGLPWLIRLDKFVEGQSYEGETELVIRGNSSETALNEAVALELLGEAGLATQRSASAALSINGGDEVLRLIIENPNDEWDAEAFDTDGLLYKAESGGDYSYRGDDPEAYADIFDQETGDEDDLAPLIDFLDFINNATDEELAAGIDERLDVDAFARYLAIEDLMGNFDDIDGPGNNSYIRIDTETGRATIVAWDHNLAFGAMGGGMGGGAMPEGMTLPEGMTPGGTLPEGVVPPRGAPPQMPGGQAPGGEAPDGAAPQGGGFGGGSNILVTRFKEVPELAARYDEALAELRAELYDSGLASTILQRRADVLREQAPELVDEATIEADVARIESQFA